LRFARKDDFGPLEYLGAALAAKYTPPAARKKTAENKRALAPD